MTRAIDRVAYNIRRRRRTSGCSPNNISVGCSSSYNISRIRVVIISGYTIIPTREHRLQRLVWNKWQCDTVVTARHYSSRCIYSSCYSSTRCATISWGAMSYFFRQTVLVLKTEIMTWRGLTEPMEEDRRRYG